MDTQDKDLPLGAVSSSVTGKLVPEQYGRITSFSLRGSRLGDKYEQVLAEHGDFYLLDFPAGTGVATIAPEARIDWEAVFGRKAPLVVEVGPGSGEQLIHSALLHPERDYLALEAWRPAVARCVHRAVQAGVRNVRIAQLDAAQALPILFSTSSNRDVQIAEVWTFFPDPWRKKRHRKRRIVSPSFAHIIAGILPTGAIWRLATDWPNYAWQMRDVIAESPWFTNVFAGENPVADDEGLYQGGFAPRYAERVVTRFEERGLRLDGSCVILWHSVMRWR